MREFTIEKDVPLSGKRGAKRYPFSEMEIGDSFCAPLGLYQSLNGSAREYQKRHSGVVFTLRKNENECRIWRLS